MSETEAASGLFSMPTLQYNEEGWGPHEISENFRVMPYQVKKNLSAMAMFYDDINGIHKRKGMGYCEIKFENFCLQTSRNMNIQQILKNSQVIFVIRHGNTTKIGTFFLFFLVTIIAIQQERSYRKSQ